MKPEAQPRHRQDSQRDKDALGRTAPKGDRAGSAFPPEGFSGSPADAGQVNHPTTGENLAFDWFGLAKTIWPTTRNPAARHALKKRSTRFQP